MNAVSAKQSNVHHFLARWTAAILFAFVVALTAQADQTQQVRAGGLDIVYGVVPGAILDANATTGDGAHMNRENARRGGSHHLVIALFDANTGQRIPDAAVSARIEALGGNVESKALPVMVIAGTITYGSFFRLDSDTPYRIHLSIQRPGRTDVIRVDWQYRHPTR